MCVLLLISDIISCTHQINGGIILIVVISVHLAAQNKKHKRSSLISFHHIKGDDFNSTGCVLSAPVSVCV